MPKSKKEKLKMTFKIVKKYLQQGFKPIPVKSGEKAPMVKDWNNYDVNIDNLEENFPQDEKRNIAIRLGAVSSGIVDIDIDNKCVQPFADLFLPKTSYIFGRNSTPKSHYIYKITDDKYDTKKFTSKDHGCLLEIRGNKCATVFPGSIHPSGEEYSFYQEGLIGEISYSILEKSAALIASCTLASLNWPAKGGRNDAAMAFSGMLCKAGFSDDQVTNAVYYAALHAGDDEAEARRNTAEYTCQKHNAGKVVTGYNAMQSCFDEKTAKQIRAWLKLNTETEIEEIVANMNQKYALIMQGGKTKIMYETKDPYSHEDITDFQDVNAFSQYFRNKQVVVGHKGDTPILKTYAQIWLEHPKRRTYDAVIFKPSSSPVEHNYYNTWKGFSVKPCSTKSCDLFLGHVKNILCGGNEELSRWVVSWMADSVQNTCRKPGTAVVLIGKQGTGKSFFGNYFGSIFKPHYFTVSQASHLTGKFNNHLSGKIILQCEEAFWAGDKSGEGVLKDLITNDHINIERKGVDVETQRNYTRMIITSNENWVIPAGLKERRFLVLKVSDEKMQDPKYFKDLADEMNNGGREALLHYLQNYDYQGVNLQRPPYTNALMDQMLEGLDHTGKFLYICLERGHIYPEGDHWPDYIPTKHFLKIYKDTICNIGLKDKSMSTILGKALKTYFGKNISRKRLTLPEYDPETGQSSNCIYMSQSSVQLAYKLPPLKVAREMFTDITGIDFENLETEENDDELLNNMYIKDNF